MLNSEWGPWVNHNGECVPLPSGTVVFVERAGGRQHEGTVSGTNKSGWVWEHCIMRNRPQDCVMRYRKKKPRGMEILEAILADVPEGVPA